MYAWNCLRHPEGVPQATTTCYPSANVFPTAPVTGRASASFMITPRMFEPGWVYELTLVAQGASGGGNGSRGSVFCGAFPSVSGCVLRSIAWGRSDWIVGEAEPVPSLRAPTMFFFCCTAVRDRSNYRQIAVGYPTTAVGYPPTVVGYPPTAVIYLPTAVGYPPTAVGYPATVELRSMGANSFFWGRGLCGATCPHCTLT